MNKIDYGLLRDGVIRPQASGAIMVTLPSTVPPLEQAMWCPKEWVIEGPSGAGIELLMTGGWASRSFAARPPGTVCGTFYQLVIHTETQAATYYIDAQPGTRLSLPCKFIRLRAIVAVGYDWSQLPSLAGLQYLFQWSASAYNGSRGYGTAQWSSGEPMLIPAGTTGPRIPTRPGARSVSLRLGVAATAVVTMRQYSLLDGVTVIAIHPSTTTEIPLDSYTGYVEVVNSGGIDIRVTYTWHYYF